MVNGTLSTLFVVSGLALGLVACSNKKQVTTPSPSMQAVDQTGQLPADFKLLIGMGGGVGGRVQGFSLDADGASQKWEGKYPEENVQRKGQLTNEDVNALWEHIKEMEYFTIKQQDMTGSGNFIMVTANGVSHRVAWKNALGQQPDATPWQMLYDRCVEMVMASFAGKRVLK